MTHNKKLDAGQLKKAENRKGCKKYPCRACMHCNNNYNYNYYYAAALETFYPELNLLLCRRFVSTLDVVVIIIHPQLHGQVNTDVMWIVVYASLIQM